MPKNGHKAEKPWVRIAIVTFNSGVYTQACIDALAAQTDGHFEAIIVDNVSTDDALDKLKLPDERFRIIRNSFNSGFAGGSNTGLAGADTPFLMTLNPDTELTPDCLAILKDATRRFPKTDMFSPVLWREHFVTSGPRIADGVGDSLSAFGIAWRNGHGRLIDPEKLPEFSETFSPSGAAALYRRDAFERAGGFDSRFFCYIEDVDLGLRLRATGSRCILVANAEAVHSGGHSTNALPGFAIRQTSRNMIAMILLSLPLPLIPIMLTQHFLAHAWFQYRNFGLDVYVWRKAGFKAGLSQVGTYLGARIKRPHYPFNASLKIMRRLSWSIRDVNQRRVRTWPIQIPDDPVSPDLPAKVKPPKPQIEPPDLEVRHN